MEGGVWRAILQYRQCALFWFCTAKKAFSWWCLAETAVWRWCSFIGSTSVISQTGLGLGNPKPFQHQRLKYQNVGAAISWTVMYVCDDSHNILQPCLFILHPPPLQSSHPQSIRVCVCVCMCVCVCVCVCVMFSVHSRLPSCVEDKLCWYCSNSCSNLLALLILFQQLFQPFGFADIVPTVVPTFRLYWDCSNSCSNLLALLILFQQLFQPFGFADIVPTVVPTFWLCWYCSNSCSNLLALLILFQQLFQPFGLTEIVPTS